MCGRITVLSLDEIRDIVKSVETRRSTRLSHTLRERNQARPGTTLHAIGLQEGQPPIQEAGLRILEATWGIEAPWNGKLVYNTRIESALGGSTMWDAPIREGRCILPAATFFEPHATETARSPKTGRQIKRQYEFAMPGETPLLLASICDGNRLSVVTTEPNTHVAPIHPRMPLALRFEEVPLWLEGDLSDIAVLADRSALELDVQPETLGPPASSRPDDTQLSLF